MFIQNQDKADGRQNKWDRQGRVVATKDNDQYLIKVDGSGRLTLRNRRFLRKFKVRSSDAPTFERHDKQAYQPESRPRGSNENVLPVRHTEISAEMNKAEHCSNPAAEQHLECTNSPELGQASPAEELPDQETNSTPTPSVTERRSSRRKKQHLVYNAATGEYVPPASR